MGIGGCWHGDKWASMHPWLHGSMKLRAHISYDYDDVVKCNARRLDGHGDNWVNPPPPSTVTSHLTRRMDCLRTPFLSNCLRCPAGRSKLFYTIHCPSTYLPTSLLLFQMVVFRQWLWRSRERLSLLESGGDLVDSVNILTS